MRLRRGATEAGGRVEQGSEASVSQRVWTTYHPGRPERGRAEEVLLDSATRFLVSPLELFRWRGGPGGQIECCGLGCQHKCFPPLSPKPR